MTFSRAEWTRVHSRLAMGVLALAGTMLLGWGADALAQMSPNRIRVGVGRSEVLTVRDSIGTVSVADDKVADVVVATPRQVLIIGKKVGVTTLVVWGRGSRYEQYDLVVHRGDTEGNQVTLNVTVAEVNRSKLRETGIDFGILRLNDDFLQGSGFLGSFSGQVSPPAFPMIFTSNVNLALDYISLGSDTRVQAIIRALEQQGSAKILANPSLVAVNGQEASFLSGGEVPIPVVQSASTGGTSSFSILFKEYGVKVDFEPTVIDSNIVNLKVKPELSRPNYDRAIVFQGYVVPEFITRRVETVVEMREGESLVIGGLRTQEKTTLHTKTPLLGDIPLLGNLFKKSREETIENELVVLVTPRFAKPMPAQQVPEFPSLFDSGSDENKEDK